MAGCDNSGFYTGKEASKGGRKSASTSPNPFDLGQKRANLRHSFLPFFRDSYETIGGPGGPPPFLYGHLRRRRCVTKPSGWDKGLPWAAVPESSQP